MPKSNRKALTGTGNGVPPGVHEIRCKHCGRPTWLARLAPESVREQKWPSKHLLVDPGLRPGRGDVVFAPDGVAIFTRKRPGTYARHRCITRPTTCGQCGAEVRVVNRPPGAPERIAVLAAEPDAGGQFVVDGNGWAVVDPQFAVTGGRRYRWHGHQQRGIGTETLMRETPRGVRS